MTPEPVKVYKIADDATCTYTGCGESAEYGVRLVDDVGEVSTVGQDLCSKHYREQILEGEILVVDWFPG
jgi:hypothetical protein